MAGAASRSDPTDARPESPRYTPALMPGGEVQLVDLVKRFGDFTAVDGINLRVDSGEFFSLLGPSGCGKTTTLRMIAGFERPTDGQVVLDGMDVATVPPHKRNVNTVFQNYALFPHLNVEKNVAFGLRYQDTSKAESARDGRPVAGARPADRLREASAEPALRRPAAAGGARASPDPESRRSSSSTSRWAPSTRSSARPSRSSSRRSRRRSASRSST